MTNPNLMGSSSAGPAGSVLTRLPSRAGIGLKPEHFIPIIESSPGVGFFEIHAENYMVAGGPFHHYLAQIREHYPLSVHGVGLSIGGSDPLDQAHLERLARLLNRYQPQSFSEHLAWSSHKGVFLNDLLPLPYTPQTLRRVCNHVDQVQSYLKRQMLLENPATYVEFERTSMAEPEFIHEVVKHTGCGLLLDINNVHVSCTNHGHDALAYIKALPLESVQEIHLAGYTEDWGIPGDRILIDSHGSPIAAPVWQLYEIVLNMIGPLPTLIERDQDVPPLDVLVAEALAADRLLTACMPNQHARVPGHV